MLTADRPNPLRRLLTVLVALVVLAMAVDGHRWNGAAGANLQVVAISHTHVDDDSADVPNASQHHDPQVWTLADAVPDIQRFMSGHEPRIGVLTRQQVTIALHRPPATASG